MYLYLFLIFRNIEDEFSYEKQQKLFFLFYSRICRIVIRAANILFYENSLFFR